MKYIKNIYSYTQKQLSIVIVILISLFAGSYLVFAHGDEKHDEIDTAGGSKYPIVTVVQAKLASLDTTSFEVSGVVHSQNQSDVFALKSGNVTQLLAETWDFVTKGQILARITAEKSDAQIGSEISLLRKEITILENQKNLIAENSDKRVDLLAQTNSDRKDLLINNQDRQTLDEANQLLPLQAQIESRKVEANIAKKQYEIDLQKIQAQLETALSQSNTRQVSITSSVIDMIDATANFLYSDSFRIAQFKNASRKVIRPELISSWWNTVYNLSERFLIFHKQYREKTISEDEVAQQALLFIQETRQISNVVAIAGWDELSERLEEIDEAIDHYGEIQLGNTEILNRIQDLETQKITTALELEQKNLEIEQLVANFETQISAQSKNIDINISIENKTLDADLKITTQELALETLLSQSNIDTQIANRNAKIQALQTTWGWGTVIYAPFSGNITARHVSVGTSISTSKPLFSLVDESRKFIRFYIWEDQYPFVEEGKQISFSSPFSPSENFTTTISRVSKSLSENTKQILVEADITDREDLDRVLTNMSLRVEIPLFADNSDVENIERKALYAIPESAIELSNNSNNIWIIDDALQVKKHTIKTDFFFDGTTYITEWITGDEWIIIGSPVDLEEGLEIDTKISSNDKQ